MALRPAGSTPEQRSSSPPARALLGQNSEQPTSEPCVSDVAAFAFRSPAALMRDKHPCAGRHPRSRNRRCNVTGHFPAASPILHASNDALVAVTWLGWRDDSTGAAPIGRREGPKICRAFLRNIRALRIVHGRAASTAHLLANVFTAPRQPMYMAVHVDLDDLPGQAWRGRPCCAARGVVCAETPALCPAARARKQEVRRILPQSRSQRHRDPQLPRDQVRDVSQRCRCVVPILLEHACPSLYTFCCTCG